MRRNIPWEKQLQDISDQMQQDKNKFYAIMFLILGLSLGIFVIIKDIVFLTNFTFSTLELIAKMITLNNILKDTVDDPSLYLIDGEDLQKLVQTMSRYELELIEKINYFDHDIYGIEKTFVNTVLFYHQNGPYDVLFRISDFHKVKLFQTLIFPSNFAIKTMFYNTYSFF